jgi:hypothetical protein
MAAAAAKASTDADTDFVYEALIYMRARVVLLEEVRQAASRFMQAGQDQRLRSALRKALNATDRSDEQDIGQGAEVDSKDMLL